MEAVGSGAMHQSVAVCSDALEISVAEEEAVVIGPVDCRHATSHRCVHPVVVDSRPVILVSRHQMMPQVAAAAGPVLLVEYQQPLSVDCSATQQSIVTGHSKSRLTSSCRHKRKRRRKNKVKCKKVFYNNTLQY